MSQSNGSTRVLQPLRDALANGQPKWTAGDVRAAERKLVKVGIASTERLRAALDSNGELNSQLRKEGLQTFTTATLQALRQYLGVRHLEGPAIKHPTADQSAAKVPEPSATPRGDAKNAGELVPTREATDKASSAVPPAAELNGYPRLAAERAAATPLQRETGTSAMPSSARGPGPSAVSSSPLARESHSARKTGQKPVRECQSSGPEEDVKEVVPRAQPVTLPEATAVPADGEELVGSWIYEGSSFEVRRVEDDKEGRALGSAPERASDSAGVSEPPRKLCYRKQLAGGSVVQGLLARVSEVHQGQWIWEGDLDDGRMVKLWRTGPHMTFRHKEAGAAIWEEPCTATKPQVYAFYVANSHPRGYRYAHTGDAGKGDRESLFPVVGFTAGWLPASLVHDGDRDVMGKTDSPVRVVFRGTFCDPFEVAPPPPAVHQIRLAQAQQGGSTHDQVVLGFDGTLLVQMASRSRFQQFPGFHGAKKPGSRSFARMPGRGWANRSVVQVPADPVQVVASAFRTTRQELRERGLFRTQLRQLPKGPVKQDLEMTVPASHVRASPSGCPRPLLSILCVRWYDYWTDPQQCSDYNTLNDGYFTDLLNGPCSVGRLLPGEYEVLTVFVRSTADLHRLKPAQLRSLLRGRNTVAWYFVWPSGEGEGYVRERDFFRFLQEMERLPLRTGWPHESSLYRILCGKLWIPQMCLNRAYRVPPTTRIHYAEFRQHPRKAATRALSRLQDLRRRLWDREEVPSEQFKGVVKLGFSWCGQDVLPFCGLTSLISNVRKLFEDRHCDNPMCLVQEMIPGVVGEHRVTCIYDKALDRFRKEAVWMETGSTGVAQVKHNSTFDVAEFKVASSRSIPPANVAARLFGGDRAAQSAAERDALGLVEHWLRWFRTESPEPPQCTRIDFLVAKSGPGRSAVWTCEVGECGASLCGWEVHGRNLAALNNAIVRDDKGRFPMALPKDIPRNNGQKS